MAEAISPVSGQRYGIQRVCRLWDVPRSSFYAAQVKSAVPAAPPARRGSKPAITDEALLAAIKRDLETSPWTGEGHRKVWARLRVRDGIRVSRKRLLRLMREHALLSPYRARRKGEDHHDRQIITEAPNVMCPPVDLRSRAIDAIQVTTIEHGKVWIFGVAEHWNAEFLGWHVTKRGTRFEATQALRMALRQQFGHLSASAARGLALRYDHRSNVMADHFQHQIRFRNISPSDTFVAEPEANGVIERLFRTLKEQIIHGRVFQTIDEVREAVRDFVDRYNAEWLIEKNGFRSLLDARAAHLDTNLRRAA
jgi:transposase InsO family protein